MDTLDQERNHFIARVAPQHSNSGSNNQISRNSLVGQYGVDQGGEVEAMDTKDNVQSQVEMQNEPTNNSTT
jgi:hypothetical protein